MSENLYDGIYLQITQALTPKGCLPPGFLPLEEQKPKGNLSPGEKDVKAMLSGNVPKASPGAKKALTFLLQLAGEKEYDKATAQSKTIAKSYRACSMMKELETQALKAHELDRDSIFFFFLEHLMLNSPVAECVKLGMILCSLPVNLDERVMNYFYTLGLYEEFTYYAAQAFARWGYPQRVLDLCKNTRGWGRLGALLFLEPKTFSCEKWCLGHLLEDSPDPVAAARIFVQHGFLEKKLSRKCSEEDIRRMGEILKLLPEEEWRELSLPDTRYTRQLEYSL